MGSNRVLVAYGSKHGATAEIAQWIGAALEADGLEADVRPAAAVDDLNDYGAVILGGALYMGRWHRSARRLARQLQRTLGPRPVWLFSSGPLDHSADAADLPAAPGVSRVIAKLEPRGHVTFGGRIGSDTPGVMAHAIADKSGGDYRIRHRIEAWARTVAAELIALGFQRASDASDRTP